MMFNALGFTNWSIITPVDQGYRDLRFELPDFLLEDIHVVDLSVWQAGVAEVVKDHAQRPHVALERELVRVPSISIHCMQQKALCILVFITYKCNRVAFSNV